MTRRKKKEITGIIKENRFPNKSIMEADNKKYIFKGGIKGQEVRIVTQRRKKDYTEAKLVEILSKSEIERRIPCPPFGICGGCAYQTLEYEEELKLKGEMLENLYSDIYSKEIIINPSPSSTAYRNKMEYSFGDREKGGELTLGMHSKGRFYEICETDNCNIVNEGYEIIRKAVQNYFRENNTLFYKKRNHEGFLRHLIVRYSFSENEYMVNLVTTSQEELNKEEFIELLLGLKLDGKIKTIIHTGNDSLSDAVVPEKVDILFGDGYLTEKLLGLEFQISPFSFFQPNPKAAEVLYSKALEFAGNINNKTVFDLYSGTGTIGQIFSQKAKKVIGIEIVEEAVEKARETCKLNNISNAEFIAGDVLEKIEELKDQADIIVLDPPRDGIHPKAIKKIINIKSEKFVYISCNPVTQVRDLKIFLENGYKLEKMELVDQFPRTVHVEALALLTK
ncbi:23S rRNA (uracil(1939)-C(5))-methyltransferase RlmD [Miniphocaeibacter halophilus]|uniref:23S rRNA (Uracil(1939)-C(5))-methyltransferase RlmD n=1 Tax=Miniphocaeibacter halophilus TaxID=2931922 RepID=A0AC61MSA3_9FIRM|nr:23S rRNA (uracil(1939)-C(5))-methyltransferase RlmD [Miniphocaeibacter halophilus]QQK08421.1 23S rRNA (uracil(1939)-C(5))-methyltransferase RlmD [Miniphocaeibacter halophilus]